MGRYHPDGGIYVTENGWSLKADTHQVGVVDTDRMYFYANYTSEMLKAIKEDGVDVRGYFAWSLMDNYEWEMGYTERFGLVYNDYNYTTDTNSPGEDSPVYDANSGKITGKCGLPCRLNAQPDPTYASRQTRHVKNSLLWMQSVWRSGELTDPSSLLASTVGGDICYGRGNYTVSGQTV